MALNAAAIGKTIINGLAQGGSVTFPTPYLGLFTQMPGADGTGGAEVSYPEYARVKINATGIEGTAIMCAPYTEEDAGKTVSAVKNQEIIYFPEAETAAGGTAVGFGLFSSLTAAAPYLWGELQEPVPIGQYSVPMFRVDNFKLMLL